WWMQTWPRSGDRSGKSSEGAGYGPSLPREDKTWHYWLRRHHGELAPSDSPEFARGATYGCVRSERAPAPVAAAAVRRASDRLPRLSRIASSCRCRYPGSAQPSTRARRPRITLEGCSRIVRKAARDITSGMRAALRGGACRQGYLGGGVFYPLLSQHRVNQAFTRNAFSGRHHLLR